MKIAAFADLHAHIFKEFDTKTDRTGSKRLDNIIDTLDFIQKDCISRDINTILFAGDAFHVRARVNTIVFNSIYDKFKEMTQNGLRIIAIPGNHDDHDNSDLPQHSLHAFKDIEGMEVVDTLKIVKLEDETPVVCARYSKNAHMLKDFISNLNEGQFTKKPILLTHLGISGAFVGDGSYPMADAFNPEDLRPDLFKYIIMGHFHRRQMIAGYNNFLYTGAPIQNSFSDEGEDKGYIILDTSKRCDIEFVPIPNPQFYTLTFDQITKEVLDEHLVWGNYLRIMLKEDEVQRFNAMVPQGLNYKIILEKVYEEQSRIDVKIGMTEEQVVKKYAEEHNPDALEIGLKILSGVKGNG